MRIAVLLVLGLLTTIALAEAPATIEGEWVLTLKYPPSPRGPRGDGFAALTIRKQGERYTGSLSTMRGKAPARRLAFANGSLSGTVQRLGSITATLADGKLTGALGRIPFTATRVTDAKDPEVDLARHSLRAAPRDRFPVLTDPPLAKAADAKWSDREMVIGVARNGQSCAFPVTTMGIHELVNLDIGKDPLAVSW